MTGKTPLHAPGLRAWFGRRPLLAAGSLLLAGVLVSYAARRLGSSAAPLSWAFGSRKLLLLEPRALALFAAWPLVFWSLIGELTRGEKRLVPRLTALRALALALLIVALGRPQLERIEQRTCTVVLLDVSASIADASLEAARRQASELWHLQSDSHQVQLVAFDSQARVVTPAPGAELAPIASLRRPPLALGSDYPRALALASGLCELDAERHLLLLGDGASTAGSLPSTLSELRAAGTEVFARAPSQAAASDIAVVQLTAEGIPQLGRTFHLRGQLASTRATHARLTLLQDGAPSTLEPARELTLTPGLQPVALQARITRPGITKLTVQLTPSEPDHFSENNAFSLELELTGPPRVLWLDPRPGSSPFAAALEAQHFSVDSRRPDELPSSVECLADYQSVVVSNVAWERLAPGAAERLASWVRERGGTLLLSGGPTAYGPGGWGHTLLEDLAPVRMEIDHRKDTPQVAMALVVDRSGSMQGAPLELAKSACRATIATLGPSDLVEVVAFDDAPLRVLSLQSALSARVHDEPLTRLRSGGGTRIFPAVDLARGDLLGVAARRKHLVLLTDGQSPSEGLPELVTLLAADGITLTIVGLGAQVDGGLLTSLTEAGGGRYHAAPNPEELPRIFTRETEWVMGQAQVDGSTELVVARAAECFHGIELDAAPLLHGYVSTSLKPAPAEALLESERGEPLLARTRQGLGWVLAWTSESRGPWISDLQRWPELGRFLAQLLRGHARLSEAKDQPLQLELLGDELKVSFEAFDEHDRFVNQLASSLVVTGPSGKQAPVPLPQVAPGRYETRVKLPTPGAYQLQAEHERRQLDGPTTPWGTSRGSVSLPYPLELTPRPEASREFEALVSALGGKLNAPAAELLVAKHAGRPHRRSLAALSALLVLGLVLLELLYRRTASRLWS